MPLFVLKPTLIYGRSQGTEEVHKIIPETIELIKSLDMRP